MWSYFDINAHVLFANPLSKWNWRYICWVRNFCFMLVDVGWVLVCLARCRTGHVHNNHISAKWDWLGYTTSTVRDICTFAVLFSVSRPFCRFTYCLCQLVKRGSDQLGSICYFGHCAHLNFVNFLSLSNFVFITYFYKCNVNSMWTVQNKDHHHHHKCRYLIGCASHYLFCDR